MNSLIGRWGREVRPGWPKGLYLNKPWAIVVTITGRFFHVTVNNVALAKTFGHRIPMHKITGIQHTGGAKYKRTRMYRAKKCTNGKPSKTMPKVIRDPFS